MDERPSMERVLQDHDAMRLEVIAALDEAFGDKQWRVVEGTPEFTTATCDGDEDGEGALPESLSFMGSWEPGDLDEVRRIVQAIGRDHGFDEVVELIDEPGQVKFTGDDRFGGRYIFGTSRNTVFGLQTGCHRWDGPAQYTPPV